MHRLHRRILFVFLLAMLGGCGRAATPAQPASPAGATTLTVFAAASLSDAFKQIGSNFERANPDVRITFNFAGSQQLAAQLGQGAPADVFASANDAQMNTVITAQRVDRTAARVFAQNRLVVVSSPSSRVAITRLQDLATPGVKIVLAAKAVPVGQYALDFLEKAIHDPAYGSDYKANVLNNVVSYEENVRSVLNKVALGEADAGIVYTSDVVANSNAVVQRLDIPTELNVLASYPIAPISDSPRAAVAQAFIDYLFANDSQLILTRYGFRVP